jgi:hypothetical protein
MPVANSFPLGSLLSIWRGTNRTSGNVTLHAAILAAPHGRSFNGEAPRTFGGAMFMRLGNLFDTLPKLRLRPHQFDEIGADIIVVLDDEGDCSVQQQARLVNISNKGTKSKFVCCSRASLGQEGLMRKVVMRSVFLGAATSAAVLISFPSFPDTSGFISKPQAVDRALKGDRFTIAPGPSPALVRAGKRVPVGCDRAFSLMSAPQFSSLFGRCVV